MSDIEFSYRMAVGPEGPERFFDEWYASAVELDWDRDPADGTDGPFRTRVATANLVRIRPERFRHANERLLLVADEIGGDLFNLVGDAFSGANLRDEIADDLEGFHEDVLFLDHVRVEPQHRGQRLGLRLAAEAITTLWGGCAAVVTYPAPFEEGDPTDGPEHDEACARLANYWAKLGFLPAGVGNLYLIDPALEQPDLERFVPADRR